MATGTLKNILTQVDALIVDDPTDIFYLTGHHLSSGRLVITAKEQKLFVDGRYLEEVEGAPLSECASFLKQYATLGFDSITTNYSKYLELKKLRKKLLPFTTPIQTLRMIKTPREIRALKEAARLGNQGILFAHSLLREGVSEEEIARELKLFWLKKGASTVAFEPIIAFGKNSSKPHHRAGKSKLKKNDIALIDAGVRLSDYASDQTETYFVGLADPRLKELYAIVYEAQERALSLCKEGVRLVEIQESVQELFKHYRVAPLFKHSLGHGLGLDVHEAPSFRDPQAVLQRGMTITIEPGLYLDGVGGVRLEKAIVITKKGYEDLAAE